MAGQMSDSLICFIRKRKAGDRFNTEFRPSVDIGVTGCKGPE